MSGASASRQQKEQTPPPPAAAADLSWHPSANGTRERGAQQEGDGDSEKQQTGGQPHTALWK